MMLALLVLVPLKALPTFVQPFKHDLLLGYVFVLLNFLVAGDSED